RRTARGRPPARRGRARWQTWAPAPSLRTRRAAPRRGPRRRRPDHQHRPGSLADELRDGGDRVGIGFGAGELFGGGRFRQRRRAPWGGGAAPRWAAGGGVWAGGGGGRRPGGVLARRTGPPPLLGGAPRRAAGGRPPAGPRPPPALGARARRSRAGAIRSSWRK